MKALIGGKVYDTDTAIQIAHDRYWDGHNWERSGRNNYLYRTKKGNYFSHFVTCWQGERDRLVALSPKEAQNLYEELPEHEVEPSEAFPGLDIQDA